MFQNHKLCLFQCTCLYKVKGYADKSTCWLWCKPKLVGEKYSKDCPINWKQKVLSVIICAPLPDFSFGALPEPVAWIPSRACKYTPLSWTLWSNPAVAGNSWRVPPRGSFKLSSNHTSPTFLVMEPKQDHPQGWYWEPAVRWDRQEGPLLMNTGCIFIVTSQNSFMSFSCLGAPAQVKVTRIHSEAWWCFCQRISMVFFQ